ncbi:MAG: Transporter, partial [Edaphobacter sp.]|nr:Transporter [Edaphobacter sp.]
MPLHRLGAVTPLYDQYDMYRTLLTRLTLRLIALLALVPSAPAQQGATVAEQYLLQMTNQHRAEHSLSPLAWDATLARAAHAHAVLIMQNPAPALHQYPGEPDLKARVVQAGAHFSTVSENVAGNATTPIDFDRAWMNSPVHRANILDPHLTAIGIAVVQRNGLLFAVQDFSRTVAVLGSNQIEQQAQQALREHGFQPATSAEARENARRTCSDPNSTTGYPLLIMQWDGA